VLKVHPILHRLALHQGCDSLAAFNTTDAIVANIKRVEACVFSPDEMLHNLREVFVANIHTTKTQILDQACIRLKNAAKAQAKFLAKTIWQRPPRRGPQVKRNKCIVVPQHSEERQSTFDAQTVLCHVKIKYIALPDNGL